MRTGNEIKSNLGQALSILYYSQQQSKVIVIISLLQLKEPRLREIEDNVPSVTQVGVAETELEPQNLGSTSSSPSCWATCTSIEKRHGRVVGKEKWMPKTQADKVTQFP